MPSEENRRKMSIAKRGKPPNNKGKRLSEESKRKIGENHVGMKGRHHSEETKQTISIAKSGIKKSAETRQKMRKPKSEETKIKMRIAKAGENNPMSKTNKEKRHLRENK